MTRLKAEVVFADVDRSRAERACERLRALPECRAAVRAERLDVSNEPRLADRRHEGCVREGHGDLHLGNIAWIAGAPVPFDCIEFNAELRWNDVVSEVAFAVMDLVDRGHPALGWRFLNAWLETTGDYDGLTVLRFFLVYRALVRAKVSAIRAAQDDVDAADRPRLVAQVHEYLALADAFAHAGRAALMITNGVTRPRAFLVPRFEILEKKEQTLEALTRPGFDPSRVIFLEKGTRDIRLSLPGLESQADLGEVSIVFYRPDSISLSVHASSAALLFLSEVYYPGWKSLCER